MYQTPKKVFNTFPGCTKLSNIFFEDMSGGTARSAGDVWDGLTNGLATGFGGDCIVAEITAATYTPSLTVAASIGADLATPVAYWFQKHPLRLRVGSTGAAGVPATTGVHRTITQRPEARGVLRMGLGDVDAASQVILDQGTMPYIDTSVDFEAHFHVANISNGNILATRGFAEFGVYEGALGVDPTAVAAANAFFFKVTAGNIQVYKTIAGVNTLLGTAKIPNADFVASVTYDSKKRQLFASIDGIAIGERSSHVLATNLYSLSLGARVCHLAAYSAATDSPLTVDFDGLIATQMSHGLRATEG
jgi:hypothetical protein